MNNTAYVRRTIKWNFLSLNCNELKFIFSSCFFIHCSTAEVHPGVPRAARHIMDTGWRWGSVWHSDPHVRFSDDAWGTAWGRGSLTAPCTYGRGPTANGASRPTHGTVQHSAGAAAGLSAEIWGWSAAGVWTMWYILEDSWLLLKMLVEGFSKNNIGLAIIYSILKV